MKNHFKNFVCLLFTVITLFAILNFQVKAGEDLKAEEIVAKHLESIGTPEKLAAIKNLISVGASQYSILRNASGSLPGKSIMVSEPGKLIFISSFMSTDYPSDKISFDGDNVNIGFIRPGLRSGLGNFILSHKDIFSEGLFGGSLSSSWSLMNLQSRKAKVESAGKKKVGGKEVYVLDYLPKGGSDLSIRLFFDAQTFQHVRTEYRQTISAPLGKTPEQSSNQSETKHLMTEEFSEFSNENGLTLPHSYRIYLLFTGRNATNELELKVNFSQFMINQNLDPKSFDINAQ